MVCVLAEKRYVRSGDACVLCEGSSEATVYIAVCVLAILCVAAIAFLSWKGSSGNNGWSERLGAFGEKTQTKYKILVTFTQVSWNTKEMPHALRHVNHKITDVAFCFHNFSDPVQSRDSVPHAVTYNIHKPVGKLVIYQL